MTTTTSFPLLSLPHLALAEIFDMVDPDDILPISLCSQRAFHFVRLNLKKRSMRSGKLYIDTRTSIYSVTMDYGRKGGKIHFLNSEDVGRIATPRFYRKTETVNIMGYCMQYGMNNRTEKRAVFFKKQKVGFKAVIAHICALFRMEVYGIGVESMRALQWAQSRQKTPIEDVETSESWKMTSEEYEYILEHSGVRSLIHNSPPPAGFQYNKAIRPLDTFSVSNGKWVTVDHLMSMDSRHIRIQDSNLGTDKISEFLEKWKKGGFSKLKWFEIRSREGSNLLDIFDDLELESTNIQRRYESDFNGQVLLTYNGYVIRRNDGVVASLQYLNDMRSMTMVVWPDANGKEFD